MSVNAVLAFIEAAEPKNEMEVALAIQMACTHAVAMAVLSRAGEGSVIVLPSHDLVETRSQSVRQMRHWSLRPSAGILRLRA